MRVFLHNCSDRVKNNSENGLCGKITFMRSLHIMDNIYIHGIAYAASRMPSAVRPHKLFIDARRRLVNLCASE